MRISKRTGQTLLWLWRWLLLVLLGMWLIYFDPFSLGQAADQASEKAFYRVSASFYPEQAAQQKILVVLINDTAIENLNPRFFAANDWPLNYLDQVNLLSQLLQHEPAALFLDVMWMKQRTQDASYTRAIAKLEQLQAHHNVPLYFAQGSVDSGITPAMQRQLDTLGTRVINGWEGVGSHYPLQIAGTDTAAMALYRQHCETTGCEIAEGEFIDPMSVRWASAAAPILLDYRQHECRVAPQGMIANVVDAATALLYAAVQGMIEIEDETPVCMPHRVLYADEVFALNRSPNEAERQAFHDLVDGATVLIGGQIEGIYDYASSPVHGSVPGVFFHAMALDNLLVDGEDYIQQTSLTELLSFLFWVLFAAFLAAIKTFSHCNRLLDWFADRVWLLTLLFASLMLLVSYGLLNLSPAGWLSLLALGWVGQKVLNTELADFKWG